MVEPAWLKVLLDVLPVVTGVIAVSTGIIAVRTFRKNAELRRAEWLYNLHAKFFESESYKEMRRVIDYEPQPEFGNLREALTQNVNPQLAERFVDYLNFFEFVASLWKLKQITTDEIAMVFEYYVRQLGDHEFVMHFVATNSFENLEQLIPELRVRKVTVKQ